MSVNYLTPTLRARRKLRNAIKTIWTRVRAEMEWRDDPWHFILALAILGGGAFAGALWVTPK